MGPRGRDTTEDRKALERLLGKVYRERGFDFRDYRESTLARRLRRRLSATGARTYADYAQVLDGDPAEYNRLFDDLTINVTSFFRDEAAFRALEEVVLPALIERGTEMRRHLRIWSAGCATGEEPYSIAMLLLHRLGRSARYWDICILGTDIDTKALQRAREGVFPPKAVERIPPALVDRYLVAEHGGFRLQPVLRELVAFEVHNLVSDAPYRDMDLVVCRNVLIYFAPALQARVLRALYEGLRPGGFLLLGRAEVPAGSANALFECVSSKAKLFRKTADQVSRHEAVPIVSVSRNR